MTWSPHNLGEAVLLRHPSVDSTRVGKRVHILSRDPDWSPGLRMPWFEVRICGEEPRPGSVYPVYPGDALGEPPPVTSMPSETEFFAALRERLKQGQVAYGDRSFSREPAELLGELEQEALDLAGWSYVLFCRIRRAKEAIEEAGL